MADFQSNKGRRGLPNGFLTFLIGATVIVLGVQSLGSDRIAQVSFSHQAEHLSNLNLVLPEESRKVAQTENLVTFSGKFRDRLTPESQDRHHYLELLSRHHSLVGEKEELLSELDTLKTTVREAADLYLHIFNPHLPRTGYTVVGPLFDAPDREHAIVIRTLTEREVPSLATVGHALEKEAVEEAAKELRNLVSLLRSPAVGIGSEPLKAELKALDQQLMNATADTQVAVFKSTLASLKGMLAQLGSEQEGVRLSSLRSVRSYLETLERYHAAAHELEQNEVQLAKARLKVADVIWAFNNQELSTRALEKQDPEVYHYWFAQAEAEYEKFNENKSLPYSATGQPRNTVLERNYKSEEPAPNYISYLVTFVPMLMVVLFLYFIFSRQMKGGVGSSAMNFGKSPARLMTRENNKVTFRDVAGCDEAKEELKEIVDFLKDPTKFTALGARIPKGVLLVGSPGTGKTLVAKAVAGEADRPFFSISGSDFVEMFVGVGASRIRDLFDQAKKNAPCIIFMDEIDAVGRHRGAGIGGGHDEREQTLNQLLVEMDGFDTKEGVILMAATNRPDILDKALLRPGRFDRRVTLDLPDVKGRFEILKVHARRIKIDPTVELMDVARSTPGASGADLENVLNEAALLAARKGRTAVTASEVKEACDKVRYGKERRSLEMDEQEKKTTAYHETGHAICGLVVKNSDPVDKVTIIPRGFSLGATHFMPKKNRLSYWKKEVLDQLIVLMGGRAAEELFVGDMSSGAQHDILQATKIARAMVCEWGMSDILGTVSYQERTESGQYLGMSNYAEKNYSEETAKKIDDEVKQLIDEGHKKSLELLQANREKVELMAKSLMEFETLDADDVKEIMTGAFDFEKKHARLKAAEESHRKLPPPLPTLDLPPQPGLQAG